VKYTTIRRGEQLVTVPVPENWEERLILRYPSLRDEILRLKGLMTPPGFEARNSDQVNTAGPNRRGRAR